METTATPRVVKRKVDPVRNTLILCLAVLHVILMMLTLAIILGDYDAVRLATIERMFGSTLTAIGANLLFLVGDRGVKNVTTKEPSQ